MGLTIVEKRKELKGAIDHHLVNAVVIPMLQADDGNRMGPKLTVLSACCCGIKLPLEAVDRVFSIIITIVR